MNTSPLTRTWQVRFDAVILRVAEYIMRLAVTSKVGRILASAWMNSGTAERILMLRGLS